MSISSTQPSDIQGNFPVDPKEKEKATDLIRLSTRDLKDIILRHFDELTRNFNEHAKNSLSHEKDVQTDFSYLQESGTSTH